jgi:carbamoyltransferase
MSVWHLGLNLGHDRSAALVRDGEVAVAIHQERLDRLKHSVGFLHQAAGDPEQIQLPLDSIHYCLEAAGIQLADVTTISANMPGVDYSAKILRRCLPPEAAAKVIETPSHHLMHAYSAYWPSGFKDAVILVADASGSSQGGFTESYSLYQASGTAIEPLHQELVPSHLAMLSTLGFLYEFVSRKAGFVTNVGASIQVPEAGKLMGLAPYGGPQTNWLPWIRTVADSYSLDISAYDIFLEFAALEKTYDDGAGKAYLRPYLVDLAWKIQHELEQALLHVADLALKRTGKRRLCLAGGVALNSVANYKLLRTLDLEDIFVFPAAGDAGVAAGCAYWAYAKHEGGRARPVIKRATLGRTYGKDAIDAAIGTFSDKIVVETLAPAFVAKQCASAIADGHIVARFEGGSEFGPRALGHRSILADPCYARMKDILNARVKFREAFRPFAPVIPEENIERVFEQRVPSPFMLVVSHIKPEFHEQIPGVTHCDGSGRVQTVTSADNPFLYQLCNEIQSKRYGPPVVLNTSFNVAGQPIVETPQEAISTFLATDIDYLFLENLRISKKGVPVLDYEHHLSRVKDGPLPSGLEPGQPSLGELMTSLDRALFADAEEGGWSHGELCALSAKGARYKETSRLYPDGYCGAPVRSQLSARAVLLADPLNGSELLDTENKILPARLDQAETVLLLTLASGDAARIESLRTERQASASEWRRLVADMIERMRAYNLVLSMPGTEAAAGSDCFLPAMAVDRTLAPFSDESYRLPQTTAALRAVLERAGYEEASICALLKVDASQQIEPTRLHYYSRFVLPDSDLGNLVRLFLLREALSEARVEALFGPDLFNALMKLGLLHERDDGIASRVDVWSLEDLFLATDHRYMVLGPADHLDESPVMYIGLDSRGLVHSAPRVACRRVLDLCTGSGVQALIASRYASEAVGVDLNPRAVRFARFNAQLNGIENVRFHLGDLYAPVSGERFDAILANPPFVPSPDDELGFRDGGRTGENVLKRIVAGAAAHLLKDGRIGIVTDLVDVGSYRARLENWWEGGAADMLVLHTADRDEILFSAPHSHAPFGQSYQEYNTQLERWVQNYRQAGLKAVNFGYVFIRRLSEAQSSTYYSRIVHSPTAGIHQEVAGYFRGRRRLREFKQGGPDGLFLRPATGLRIRQEHDGYGVEQLCELVVPGNPYFTTYQISSELSREFQWIATREPSLAECSKSPHWAFIQDLIFKGLLELEAPGKNALRAETVAFRSSPQRGVTMAAPLGKASRAAAIGEAQTKTTPTCLSSYLA